MSEHMAEPTLEAFHTDFVSNTPRVAEAREKEPEYKPDSIVQTVLNKFIERSKFGKQKYGTDLDRQDLSVLDWINHAQEEHMDAILYLEKLKQTIREDAGRLGSY